MSDQAVEVVACAVDAPVRSHPIDVAVAALGEYVADIVRSSRPSRFTEVQAVAGIAAHLQAMRVERVADVDATRNAEMVRQALGADMVIVGNPGGANDVADLHRELLMMAQTYLTQYVEVEKKRAERSGTDNRLETVDELAELFTLRLKIAAADQDVPPEINFRIDTLLKRVGEPTSIPPSTPGDTDHEPAPDPVVPAVDLRGHQVDVPGGPDGSGVGAPVADGA